MSAWKNIEDWILGGNEGIDHSFTAQKVLAALDLDQEKGVFHLDCCDEVV